MDIRRRETIAQALDYVASIKRMPVETLRDQAQRYLERHPDEATSSRVLDLVEAELEGGSEGERSVIAFIVGTSRDPGAERLVQLLGDEYDVPIEAVTFSVFEVEGSSILVRDVPDFVRATSRGTERMLDLEAFKAKAAQNGHGAIVERVLQAATDVGLAARPYKQSLMITPSTNRSRMLFTIKSKRGQRARIYTSGDAFEEFFPQVTSVARQALGRDGWKEIDEAEAEHMAAALVGLLAEDGPTTDSPEDRHVEPGKA